MARPALYRIIACVRELLGDSGLDCSGISDDQIQRALDSLAITYRNAVLPITPVFDGNQWSFTRLEAPIFGESVTLADMDTADIVPQWRDDLNGQYDIPAQTGGRLLYSGVAHDVYGAAADLLETQLRSGMVASDNVTQIRTGRHAVSFDRAGSIVALQTYIQGLRDQSQSYVNIVRWFKP